MNNASALSGFEASACSNSWNRFVRIARLPGNHAQQIPGVCRLGIETRGGFQLRLCLGIVLQIEQNATLVVVRHCVVRIKAD